MLSPEIQQWLGINLNFDFYGFIGLERHIIYIRIVFQESGFHLTKSLFIFLFNLHLTTDNSKFIYYRLEVFREIELVIKRQEGKIHILAEALETMKNSKTGTTIESGHIEEAAIVEPGKYHLLVHFKYGIPHLLFRSHIV